MAQSALAQPALAQPAITQPALTQPALTQPALTQPALTQTDLNENITQIFSGISLTEKKNLIELSVAEILNLASKGQFPKKKFIIAGNIKSYTARLHFLKSIAVFSTYPENEIKFECKLCGTILQSIFPYFSNLSKHLKYHEDFINWLKLFNTKFKVLKRAALDDNLYDLVRFFISSNSSLSQIMNPYLRKLIEHKMSLPSPKTFRHTLIPQVYEQMKSVIDSRLDSALSICLITDIWTNVVMADFIGLGASIINECFESELLIIGMMSMNGNHTAENIKIALERLVNSYKCSKINFHGNFSCYIIHLKLPIN